MNQFWKIMYALALAEAIHKAPFDFNPHKLKYNHYKCTKCWSPAGTRAPCACPYKPDWVAILEE